MKENVSVARIGFDMNPFDTVNSLDNPAKS
jgi:hypothetical protein